MLLTAGDHVPLTPFKDVVGNVGATSPLHIAAIGAKVGKVAALTLTTKDPAHACPVLLSV